MPLLPGHCDEQKREPVIQSHLMVHAHTSADMSCSFIICLGTQFETEGCGNRGKKTDLPVQILNVLWSQKLI